MDSPSNPLYNHLPGPQLDQDKLHKALTRLAAKMILLNTGRNIGLEVHDLVSAGWLAYQESVMPSHAGRMSHAKYAMIAETYKWLGHSKDSDTRFMQAESTIRKARFEPVYYPGRTNLPRSIKRALKALPHRERRALKLWTFFGYTHEEIATLLGMSVSHSRNLRAKALASLRLVRGVR